MIVLYNFNIAFLINDNPNNLISSTLLFTAQHNIALKGINAWEVRILVINDLVYIFFFNSWALWYIYIYIPLDKH